MARDYSPQLFDKLEQEKLELAAAVEQLRASEERWRTIFNTDPECVKIVSPEGQLLEMNPAGLSMLEAASFNEAISKPLLEWVAPEHRDAFAQLHRYVMQGHSAELEFEVIGQNGRRRKMRTQAAPLRDAEGKITALLGISRDITAERQLEAQARHSQKMEAIGLLAGGIAHDFNNLLTVIQGFAMTMLEEDCTPAEMRSATEQIVQAAERAASLTRQLLAFGRRQVMQPRLVDLNELVTGLASMVRRVLGEDVNLQLLLAPGPITINADSGMIDQVLMNLVINAREAMPAGGLLQIQTMARELQSRQYACLRVVDSGAGIPPEHMSKIFDPFFTTKPASKGSGLGLATAFSIVAQHGGRIEVTSTLGKGATFDVLLPFVQGQPAEAPAAVDTAKTRSAAETILLVEDEASVRMLTRHVLERGGYRVLEAETGVEGLRVFHEYSGTIDLVLTDVVMPDGMNGHDLAEKLQARQPGLKVIFTSGYSPDFAGRPLSLKPGQSFLQKPAPPKAMLEAVRRALSG